MEKRKSGPACQLVAFCLAAVMPAWGAGPGSERLAFPLEEVSGFDVADVGHTCACRNEPELNVAYPAFTSAKPLYGVMCVDMEFANLRSGTPYHFALDESGGTGTGYDRLYLDHNRDGRLSDEAPIAPLRELPPGRLLRSKWIAPPVWFGYVTFSSTDATGTHSVETLPHLMIDDKGVATLSFMATEARRGTIQVARRRFDVTVLNSYPLGTHWDRSGTVVRLEIPGGGAMPYWFGSDRLMAMHLIDGRYWRFGVTPGGDQFSVEPYRGDLGIIEFDVGGWFLRTASFSGSLKDKERILPIGQQDQYGILQLIRRSEVPVGDYTLAFLDVRCGPLSFNLFPNSDADGMPDGCTTNPAYSVQVRKGKPCTLGLARKGNVVFGAPGQGTRLRPGDELRVATTLVDPKCQAMIGNLCRTPREQASVTVLAIIGLMIAGPLAVWAAAGKKRQRHRYLPLFSGIGLLALAGYLGGLYALNVMLHPGRPVYEELTPQVTITRASGEKVAGGPMPFG